MRYICQICGFVYDEGKEKVPFDTLPENWRCPVCGASTGEFVPEQSEKPALEAEPTAFSGDADLKELSAGELSILCSHLARVCREQHKMAECASFNELAGYFASITPNVEDADMESLAALLKTDLDSYPALRATADEAADRGAARVCVWGGKVTGILSSLVNRYLKEGEAMLVNTGVWVCTACGFVYIGDDAPSACPVCKAPAWKFESIEGRN